MYVSFGKRGQLPTDVTQNDLHQRPMLGVQLVATPVGKARTIQLIRRTGGEAQSAVVEFSARNKF